MLVRASTPACRPQATRAPHGAPCWAHKAQGHGGASVQGRSLPRQHIDAGPDNAPHADCSKVERGEAPPQVRRALACGQRLRQRVCFGRSNRAIGRQRRARRVGSWSVHLWSPLSGRQPRAQAKEKLLPASARQCARHVKGVGKSQESFLMDEASEAATPPAKRLITPIDVVTIDADTTVGRSLQGVSEGGEIGIITAARTFLV